MLKQLSRFDAGIARGEAALAALFLISMILAASFQALFRNIAGLDIDWANWIVQNLTWVDPFLQKGTLWLAFLGASLATREGRHIGIDILPRIAPKRTRLLMRGIAAAGSALVSFFLARAFWGAVLNNARERPAEFEVWGDEGPMHVCDATAQQILDAGLDVPSIFCGVRSALGATGVPVETPWAALELIVPVMFLFMSIRLVFNSGDAFLKLATGREDEEKKPPERELEGLGKPGASSGSVKDEEE